MSNRYVTKSHEWEKASSLERIYLLYGIPKSHWDVTKRDVWFSDILVADGKNQRRMEADKQFKKWEELEFEETQKILFVSAPTELPALNAAVVLGKRMYVRSEHEPMRHTFVRFVDASSRLWGNVFDDSLKSRLVVVHNVDFESPNDHLQNVRNWVSRLDEVDTVIVTASAPKTADPIQMMEKLRIDFDMVFWSQSESFKAFKKVIV